ncbi:MAG: carboxypeptidase-like regulatory domain-containing protein, partial [Nitrospinota bacterium]
MNGVTVNRSKIKRHLCYIMLSLFLSSIISCSSGERDGEAPPADATVQKIDIEMKSAGISPSASNYTEIYLKISGPDIEPAIERTTGDITTPIQFSIYVPPGGKRMFLAQARDSSKNVIFEGSLIKDIEPDMPITINIFISPGDYSISGRILLSSGVGLVGAEVTLSGSGQNIPGPVHTDCSGAYTFSGLYNGDYTITSSMTGFKFDRDSIDVTVNNKNVTGRDFKSVDSKPIYVDSNWDCTSGCDGSIESPYNTIQGAIDSARAGDTVIRVAGGEGGWYN